METAALTSHEEKDAMVRAALAEQGDSGITPRHTLFYFYGEEEAHGDLCEVARRAGFLTRGQGDMTVLETTMPVDEASFSPVSAMMQTWAAAGGTTFLAIFKSSPQKFRRRTLLGIGGQFMQQLSGINLITYVSALSVYTLRQPR